MLVSDGFRLGGVVLEPPVQPGQEQQDVGLGLGLAVGGLLLQDADDLLVIPPQDAVADAGLNPDLLRRNAGAQAEASVDDEAVVGDVLDAENPMEAVGVDEHQVPGLRVHLYVVNDYPAESLGEPEDFQVFMPVGQNAIAGGQTLLMVHNGERSIPHRVIFVLIFVFVWGAAQRNHLP